MDVTSVDRIHIPKAQEFYPLHFAMSPALAGKWLSLVNYSFNLPISILSCSKTRILVWWSESNHEAHRHFSNTEGQMNHLQGEKGRCWKFLFNFRECTLILVTLPKASPQDPWPISWSVLFLESVIHFVLIFHNQFLLTQNLSPQRSAACKSEQWPCDQEPIQKTGPFPPRRRPGSLAERPRGPPWVSLPPPQVLKQVVT